MVALRWLLTVAGVAMFGTAAGVVVYDVYLAMQFQKLIGSGQPGAAERAGTRRPIEWSPAAKVVDWACAPPILAGRFVPIPERLGPGKS